MTATDTVRIEHCQGQGQRLRVQTSEPATHELPAEIAGRHGVVTGAEFTLRRWHVILAEAESRRAYETLLGLLSRRAHSENEIRRKLRARQFPLGVVREAIARARAAGFLDDRKFAELYTEERLQYGAVGKLKIQAELRQRGIPRNLADEALAARLGAPEDARESEFASALTAGRRKWRSLERQTDPQKRKASLLRFLGARGFTAEIAYDVLRALGEPAPEE